MITGFTHSGVHSAVKLPTNNVRNVNECSIVQRNIREHTGSHIKEDVSHQLAKLVNTVKEQYILRSMDRWESAHVPIHVSGAVVNHGVFGNGYVNAEKRFCAL